MFEEKKPYLDNTAQNFIDNLYIEKPLYEMTCDDARKFLSTLQRKYHFDIDAEVENVNTLDPETEVSLLNSFDPRIVQMKYCR